MTTLTKWCTSGDQLQLICSQLPSPPSLHVTLSIRAKLSLQVLVVGARILLSLRLQLSQHRFRLTFLQRPMHQPLPESPSPPMSRGGALLVSPHRFQAVSRCQLRKTCAALVVSILRRATDTCRASTLPPARTRTFCSRVRPAPSSRRHLLICSRRGMPKLSACESCFSRFNTNILSESSDRLLNSKMDSRAARRISFPSLAPDKLSMSCDISSMPFHLCRVRSLTCSNLICIDPSIYVNSRSDL